MFDFGAGVASVRVVWTRAAVQVDPLFLAWACFKLILKLHLPRDLAPAPILTRARVLAPADGVARCLDCVVGFVVARYIIVVVALATAISLLAQQISSIRLHGVCDEQKSVLRTWNRK